MFHSMVERTLQGFMEYQGSVQNDSRQTLLRHIDHESLRSVVEAKVKEHLEGSSQERFENLGMYIFEDAEPEGDVLNMGTEEWVDLEFEVALDTGSIVHICAEEDTPGYSIEQSSGSRRKQNFVVGDGGTLPNLGQKTLNLDPGSGENAEVTFQIAKVTRPLMSGGLICDKGFNISVDKDKAIVRDKLDKEVLRFIRKNGGLYIAKMRLKAPFVGRG